MTSILPAVPEEQMTWRARAYLVITALQHSLIGLACILLSHTFDGDGFRDIRDILDMWKWGVVFLAGGLSLGVAAVRGHETLARISLTLSAVMTAMWAMCFFLAFREGGVVSPIGAILSSSLTMKDLVICAQPLRSPFEPLVKEYSPSRTR